MPPDLTIAITTLHQATQHFSSGQLSSVAYRDSRERAIADALRAMAADHQVLLQEPLQVDSNGEFSIIAVTVDGTGRPRAGGRFGVAFAQALTQHRARTGSPGPNVISDCNGWCRLNHFDAERLVNAYFELALARACTSKSR